MPRAAVAGGRPAHRVVFDGQSLNIVPSSPAGVNYPARAMEGRPYPGNNVAISGTSWTVLATTVTTRRDVYATAADNTTLVLQGGQADVLADDTGATVMADIVSYAQSARTAGFDTVIATTMPPMTPWLSEDQETALAAFNTLLLADAGGDFDYVVDLNATALGDNSDLTYYQADLIHWTAAGAQLAADTISSTLDTVLT